MKVTRLSKKEADKIVKDNKDNPAVSNIITVGPNRLITQDINNWVKAINAARDSNFPRRRLLYELYERIIIDGHLESVMEKRKIAITNQKLQWRPKNEDDQAGIERAKDFILNKEWFHEFKGYAMDYRPWGHSLIELVPEAGVINKVELISRGNVMPELGLLIYNYANVPARSDNGIFRTDIPVPSDIGMYYRDDPRYSNYLVEVGGKKNYGKLMTAAQYVIYKRGGFGHWAKFAELFGMPFRVGKYDPYNAASRKNLEDGLEKMGSAAWAAVANGSSIELLNGNDTGTGHNVFKGLIDACNEELSKLFLGNTLTTQQGDKGARSLGDVHKSVEEDINVSDMLEMEIVFNARLIEKLKATGMPVPEGRICFNETSTIPLEKRIDIDKKLAVDIGLPMTQKYLYNTYGVEVPEDGDIPVSIPVPPSPFPNNEADAEEQDANNGDDKPPANAKKKATKLSRSAKQKATQQGLTRVKLLLHSRLDSIYSHTLKHVKLSAGATPDDTIKTIWDRIAKELHTGKLQMGELDPELVKWTAGKLLDGVFKGYGSTLAEVPQDSKDYQQLKALEEDVHVFSGFKTYQQLREATDELKDSNGNIKSFAQFKDDIQKVNTRYNTAYLQAEYQQAVAASQANSQWVDFEAAKETLPTLTFKTAGDDHVRPEHALLDGVTKPVDDSFWDTYMPPLDWGCRCDVVQVDEEVTSTSKGDMPEVKDMFAINWGKEKIVFPDTHPYYDISKAERKDIDDQLNNIFPDVP